MLDQPKEHDHVIAHNPGPFREMQQGQAHRHRILQQPLKLIQKHLSVHRLENPRISKKHDDNLQRYAQTDHQ